MVLRFEWDAAKNDANEQKHGLRFEEAKELFTAGGDYLEIYDEDHFVGDEERFIAIGPIGRGLVVAVFTEQRNEEIRIISARFATLRERALYREHMEQEP